MSDAIVEQAPAASPAAPKKATKKAATGPKKPKAKSDHPPVSQMILEAITALKERKGSSLPAIKKYIAANYKVDVTKLAPFIKKSIKASVVAGKLIQPKGKGASGSFKLPIKEKKEVTKKPKKVVKKATGEKKVKAKKPSAVKKAKAEGAKAAKKSGTVKPKQKSTKPTAAAKKPKTPKPKKTVAKKPAAKKAAPKKK